MARIIKAFRENGTFQILGQNYLGTNMNNSNFYEICNRIRERPMKQFSKEDEDEEFFLKKEWANYMAQQHNNQMEQIKRAIKSQEIALKELKKDNLDLYNKAIQVIINLKHFLFTN